MQGCRISIYLPAAAPNLKMIEIETMKRRTMAGDVFFDEDQLAA
jgi:hypothetical protein